MRTLSCVTVVVWLLILTQSHCAQDKLMPKNTSLACPATQKVRPLSLFLVKKTSGYFRCIASCFCTYMRLNIQRVPTCFCESGLKQFEYMARKENVMYRNVRNLIQCFPARCQLCVPSVFFTPKASRNGERTIAKHTTVQVTPQCRKKLVNDGKGGKIYISANPKPPTRNTYRGCLDEKDDAAFLSTSVVEGTSRYFACMLNCFRTHMGLKFKPMTSCTGEAEIKEIEQMIKKADINERNVKDTALCLATGCQLLVPMNFCPPQDSHNSQRTVVQQTVFITPECIEKPARNSQDGNSPSNNNSNSNGKNSKFKSEDTTNTKDEDDDTSIKTTRIDKTSSTGTTAIPVTSTVTSGITETIMSTTTMDTTATSVSTSTEHFDDYYTGYNDYYDYSDYNNPTSTSTLAVSEVTETMSTTVDTTTTPISTAMTEYTTETPTANTTSVEVTTSEMRSSTPSENHYSDSTLTNISAQDDSNQTATTVISTEHSTKTTASFEDTNSDLTVEKDTSSTYQWKTTTRSTDDVIVSTSTAMELSSNAQTSEDATNNMGTVSSANDSPTPNSISPNDGTKTTTNKITEAVTNYSPKDTEKSTTAPSTTVSTSSQAASAKAIN